MARLYTNENFPLPVFPSHPLFFLPLTIMRIRKQYGVGRWRKMKGVADVRLQSGGIRKAELHWYEAHGIGRKKMKIKRLLD